MKINFDSDVFIEPEIGDFIIINGKYGSKDVRQIVSLGDNEVIAVDPIDGVSGHTAEDPEELVSKYLSENRSVRIIKNSKVTLDLGEN